jgi:hypothetical protein
VILRFQPKSVFYSKRDTWDLKDFCDFAISTGRPFYSKRDLLDFCNFCDFAISNGKQFLIQERAPRFQGFLILPEIRFLDETAIYNEYF